MMPARSRGPGPVRLVLPSERHVERLSRGGIVAGETRAKLRARLLAALAPTASFATAEHTRMALAEVLPAIAESDALLRPIARASGAAWLRTVDAIDEAIGALRIAGVDSSALLAVERVEDGAAGRARVLRRTMTALDELLARGGLHDGRAAGVVLARAIRETPPRRVREIAGASRFVAQWIVAWDAIDLVWWRALDAALAKTENGGGAVIELPSVEGPLDAERDRAPLEVVAFEVARGLDGAPHAMDIDAPLGDLALRGEVGSSLTARGAKGSVQIRAGVDARAQARAAVSAVRSAIASATPVDAIAIAVPSLDDETLEPLRRALDDAAIVAHEPRGRSPMRTGLVAFAMDVLSLASRGLPRRDVAALLRSNHIDAARVSANDDPALGANACDDLAKRLDETASPRHEDAVASLAATAGGDARVLALGVLLSTTELARTRADHIASARAIWDGLGLRPRVGRRAARALASDEAPTDLVRKEIRAMAEEARAWVAFHDALASYERAALDLDLGGRALSSDAFRHELLRIASAAPPPPSGARAGAVRIARIAELAGEPLALLVVLDANEGVLPSSAAREAFLSDALLDALRLRAGHAPPMPHVRAARDLAALAVASSRADAIVLCHRESDAAGGLLAPAPLVAWLARGGIPTSRFGSSPVAGEPLSLHDATLRALASTGDDDARARLSPRAARLARIERERETLFEGGRDRSPTMGALAPDASRARILSDETGGGARPLAVTALERIATCAFQGFASQVLGAREPLSVSDAPDPRETGTLVHDALAAAFRGTAKLWAPRPRDRDAILARGLAAAEAVLDASPAASPLRRLTIERARADVRAVIEWSLADESWDFAAAEQAFGDGRAGSWPALTLEDSETMVRLRGKIDRVDVGHARAAVRALDYKTSGASANEAGKELGETSFQVALYADVAADHHAVRDRDGVYVPARATLLTPEWTRPKAHDKTWDAATASSEGSGEPTPLVQRALRVIRDLRRGALSPAPRSERACDVCAYDGGCRKPRFAIGATREDET